MRPNQFSQSAAFIAIKFYGLTRRNEFRSLFNKETIRYYEKIVRVLPAPLRYYHYWLKFRWVRTLCIKAEELFLPGDLMHVLVRKWYIGQMVEELLSDGYDQILVLGSGFDHLGLQHAQQKLPVLELDMPRMVRFKKRFLSINYPDKSHPDILPLHLPRQTLAELLRQQETISADKKTIIIAEGFFDYLDCPAVDTTLASIRNYFVSPALVSTHFALDELPSFHRLIFRSSLRMVKEKLEFGASMAEFKDLLHSHDFYMHSCFSPQELNKAFHSSVNTSLPVLKGFYLFCAQ